MSSPDSKVSRYRSVRNAATASSAPTAQDDMPQNDGNAEPGVVRSRSRYHRKPGQPSSSPTPVSPMPNRSPALSPSLSQHSAVSNSQIGPSQPAPRPPGMTSSRANVAKAPAPTGQAPVPPGGRALSPQAEAERKRRLAENAASRQTQDGTNRPRGPSAGPPAARRLDPPTGSNAPQNIGATTVNTKEEKSAGCFGGLFGKKKNKVVHQPPARANEPKPAQAQFIKAGGGGIVPGADAPKSAVNSGERRVLIEYNDIPMQFPVHPTTTPADLLQSAANVYSDPLDPKVAILVENFSKVGIQRPLRRYEHVRDIMNSWDDDRQNSLLIMRAIDYGTNPNLLLASNTPKKLVPSTRVFLMWISQKVGKWEKRYIGIRPDGQLYCKKLSFSPDDEAVNICHLTDYDIYQPTLKQIQKKIKPPKKIVFGIKSQQKSSMFETSSDYVHFFCSDQKDESIEFYTAVQGWRSWYLVHTLGEGKKPTATAGSARGRAAVGPSVAAPTPPVGNYQIGSFKPLVDTDKIVAHAFLSQEKEVVPPEDAARRQAAGMNRATVPISTGPSGPPQELDSHELLVSKAKTRTSLEENNNPLAHLNGNAFASGGLLGDSYSQRQRDIAATGGSQSNNPFTGGASLLNGSNKKSTSTQSDVGGFRRNPSSLVDPSTRSSGPAHSAIAGASSDPHNLPRRGNSVDTTTRSAGAGAAAVSRGTAPPSQHQQQPLVDLTAVHREPPQHQQRKGRGHFGGASATNNGSAPLVDSATSPNSGDTTTTTTTAPSATRELHSASLGNGGGSGVGVGPGTTRTRSDSRSRAEILGPTSAAPAPPPATSSSSPTRVAANGTTTTSTTAAGRAGAASPAESSVLPAPTSSLLAGTKTSAGGGADEAFVRGGLLDGAAQGLGASGTGRGVATGAQAERQGRKLLDLEVEGAFTAGSLLARREAAAAAAAVNGGGSHVGSSANGGKRASRDG